VKRSRGEGSVMRGGGGGINGRGRGGEGEEERKRGDGGGGLWVGEVQGGRGESQKA